MVQIGRMGYYAISMFAPVLVCMLIALFTPKSAMRAVITAAVCIILLWFGVIRPISMFCADASAVNMYVRANTQGSSGVTLIDLIVVLKNYPALRHTVFETWALFFVNALIKAGFAAVCMLVVYSIKSLFTKKSEE